MQLRSHFEDGVTYPCDIPAADCELLPGLPWGDVGRVFTPAYWRLVCVVRGGDRSSYRLGESLREEVAACLLGGHGITGELGTAAFRHLRARGLVNKPGVSAQEIESVLKEPLRIGERHVRYRFPNRKAKQLAGSMNYLDRNLPPEGMSARELRDWLTPMPGVGMKTASWIVRNWLDADDVAILDIHVHRAGVLAGIFAPDDDIAKNYLELENRFVTFASALNVSAAVLDNQIWQQLREAPNVVRQMLITAGAKSSSRCGLPGKTRA